jgi:PUA-domain protein
MPETRKRHFLRTKESKELLDKASERLNLNLRQIFKDKAKIEAVETDLAEILLINGNPALVKTDDNIYPALVPNKLLDVMPKVVVDMGAVPYVCKGANIMAPGIRSFQGQFKKNDLVLVLDEKHGKPLAVGEVAYDSEQAKNVKQGIVVKNLHYVGDNIWDLTKEYALLHQPLPQSEPQIHKTL